MALKLSLKPGERLALNGAVLTNGNRRTTLTVETKARVLRERDILQPEEVTTPATRIYFPVMMMYLDPASRAEHHKGFARFLTDFMSVVENHECQKKCLSIAASVANEDYYRALTDCRFLMDYEKERLSHVA